MSDWTELLADPALEMAAAVLDDIERVLLANQNRLRAMTRSEADVDGEIRGLGLDERHPDVARLAAIVATLDVIYKDATRNLEKIMRRHPLYPWAKSIRGVGDKQIARLLAAVHDPYVRPEIVRDDGTVLPAGPRTVSALWAYCGLHVLPAGGHHAAETQGSDAAGRGQLSADHDGNVTRDLGVGGAGGDLGRRRRDDHHPLAGVAPRRARGTKANWSTKAKTRAYLISESCMKQLVKPCAKDDDAKWATHVEDCGCSPFRRVYDARRAHTAVTQPEWTDGHAQNDALRVVSKALLKDLWRAAKDYHESIKP